MRSLATDVESRLRFWVRVREFAVPPSMIESATTRRRVGDWAGACAAARIDADISVRTVARAYGHEAATRLRSDLRQLAPDLLRWHMPRIAPAGLLRPALTMSLASYDVVGHRGLHLVARTPPGWADAGQRISLALWEGSRSPARPCRYPHPHPDQRHRLDLHRHLWDVRRVDELRVRSGTEQAPAGGRPAEASDPWRAELQRRGCAVDRWADEAAIVLGAAGHTSGAVAVRLRTRRWLVLDVTRRGAGPPSLRIATARPRDRVTALPTLPDAATWTLPDLALLRNGLIEVDRLHPLVAAALVPDRRPADAPPPDRAVPLRLVNCRGAQHRIGLVDGALTPLDHHPAEVRREELLASLTGTPLPCLRAIDEAHRHPERLPEIRARLDHGDIAGAMAVVEGLLGADARLPSGVLKDELEAAARRRITYGLFRAGLAGPGPGPGPGPGAGPGPTGAARRCGSDRRRRQRRLATVR